MRYRGYQIYKNTGRFPKTQYVFCHDEYDSHYWRLMDEERDPRCGYTDSIEECKKEIDEIEDAVNAKMPYLIRHLNEYSYEEYATQLGEKKDD